MVPNVNKTLTNIITVPNERDPEGGAGISSGNQAHVRTSNMPCSINQRQGLIALIGPKTILSLHPAFNTIRFPLFNLTLPPTNVGTSTVPQKPRKYFFRTLLLKHHKSLQHLTVLTCLQFSYPMLRVEHPLTSQPLWLISSDSPISVL